MILTKGLGVGIYSAAIKMQALSESGYREMIASTTLNRIGSELAQDASVHAVTDVTGFGLLGHALEMARGSGCTLIICSHDVPLFSEAASLAVDGHATGASWAQLGELWRRGKLTPGMPEWRRHLLTDPQTSGGLLVACETDRAAALVERIVADGYPSARIIGHARPGAPTIAVEA